MTASVASQLFGRAGEAFDGAPEPHPTHAFVSLLTVYLVLLCLSTNAIAVSRPDCSRGWAGRKVTEATLQKLLDQTKDGAIEFCYADLSYADLRERKLRGADLRGANLFRANLSFADLSEVNLEYANLAAASIKSALLARADLGRALLTEADLSRSDLFAASLREANLFNANLTQTQLRDTDLRDSRLEGANLEGANLLGTELSGATLIGSNLRNVNFQPRSLPTPRDAALARNLDSMKFVDSPSALVALREEFRRYGFREQELALTVAIRRGSVAHAWSQGAPLDRVDAVFSWVFFDLTSEYGRSPGRPLRILGSFILLFSIPYMIALSRETGGGIWVVSADPPAASRLEMFRLTSRTISPKSASRRASLGSLTIAFSTASTALYFSLLSALSFGPKGFNPRDLIAALQPDETILRATGWVRTLAGVETLLSLFLLALWFLAYFGRPFD